MANRDFEPKARFREDDPEDEEPDVVGTPEGDGEFAPDEPLTELPEGAEQE